MERFRGILITTGFIIAGPLFMSINAAFIGESAPWLALLLDIAHVVMILFAMVVLVYLATRWYGIKPGLARQWRAGFTLSIYALALVGGVLWPYMGAFWIWWAALVCLVFIV